MPDFKTLQFPSTPKGQREKIRALKVHTEAGWTIVSETITAHSTDVEKAVCDGLTGWCCCGPLGLSLGLRGAQTPAVITVTLRADSAEVRHAAIPDVSQLPDELLQEAARVVVKHGEASTPLLQRTLKIGYGRASRLMAELEAHDVIVVHKSKATVQMQTLEELESHLRSRNL